jgi:heme exporter protein CcmD
MGGHALYVWGSYGVAALLMLVEPWLAVRRRRMALRNAAAAEIWRESNL